MPRPPRPISDEEHQLLGMLAAVARSIQLIEDERGRLVEQAKQRGIPARRISEAARVSLRRMRKLSSD